MIRHRSMCVILVNSEKQERSVIIDMDYKNKISPNNKRVYYQLMKYYAAGIRKVEICYKNEVYHEFKFEYFPKDMGRKFTHTTYIDIQPKWRRKYTYNIYFGNGNMESVEGDPYEKLYQYLEGHDFYEHVYNHYIIQALAVAVKQRKEVKNELIKAAYDAKTRYLESIGQMRPYDYLIEKLPYRFTRYGCNKFGFSYEKITITDIIGSGDNKFIIAQVDKCPSIKIGNSLSSIPCLYEDRLKVGESYSVLLFLLNTWGDNICANILFIDV